MVISPLLALAQTAEPDYMGINYASVNLNIRSEPTVGDNLIGYLNQGAEVTVTAVMAGDWCRVSHENSADAYVYCPYLTKPAESSPVTTAAPEIGDPLDFSAVDTTADGYRIPIENFTSAADLLSSFNRWLLAEGMGKRHINDSYWQAYNYALSWREEAQLADFLFEYPPSRPQYCTMTFSSSQMRRHYFKSWCFSAGSDEVETIVLKSGNIPKGFDRVQMLFSDFTLRLMNDSAVMEQLRDYLEDGAEIKAYFRLYDRAGQGPVWEARFVNAATGESVTVRVGANDRLPVLSIEETTI